MGESGLKPALQRVFSMRHEFPNEWNAFLQSKREKPTDLTLDASSERFPYLFRGMTKTIRGVHLFIKAKEDQSVENATVEIASPDEKTVSLQWGAAWDVEPKELRVAQTAEEGEWGPGEWTINVTNASFSAETVEDLMVLMSYTVAEHRRRTRI